MRGDPVAEATTVEGPARVGGDRGVHAELRVEEVGARAWLGLGLGLRLGLGLGLGLGLASSTATYRSAPSTCAHCAWLGITAWCSMSGLVSSMRASRRRAGRSAWGVSPS